MRGKVLDRQIFPIIRRITPAYAGKRAVPVILYRRDWDHPRLCGEKFHRLCFCKRHLGSPPPMRGKVAAEDVRLSRIRITPAYAGKSRLSVAF